MKVLRLSILSILVFTILSAHARMYQWIDPASKITQFSGKPPVWYRSAKGGPRVIVFENNRIIDDTNIRVSDVEQQRLRRQAFVEAESDRETAKEKLVKAKRLEAFSKQTEDDEEQTPVPPPMAAEQSDKPATPAKAPAPTAAERDVEVVNQMRMLIQAWEKNKAASARALVEPAAPASR
jgi:hypothetical protein